MGKEKNPFKKTSVEVMKEKEKGMKMGAKVTFDPQKV